MQPNLSFGKSLRGSEAYRESRRIEGVQNKGEEPSKKCAMHTCSSIFGTHLNRIFNACTTRGNQNQQHSANRFCKLTPTSNRALQSSCARILCARAHNCTQNIEDGCVRRYLKIEVADTVHKDARDTEQGGKGSRIDKVFSARA